MSHTTHPNQPSSLQIPFEELKLSNGLTVWLSQDHSQPKVYGSVIVHIGAKDSPDTGIAHYFEHIMFKGTDKIGTVDYTRERPILDKISEKYAELKRTSDPSVREKIQVEINRLSIEAAEYAVPNDFNNLISKYGGTELNAGTSYDYTIYYNAFMPEYLEHWCMLNSERLLSPVFRLFQSELETVYEEKNMYSDQPATGVQQALFKRLTAPHPYQYPIIGSTEALKSPDLHEMKDFFDKYYTAGNMGLILTGDFEREGLEELLERTFGRLKAGRAQRPAVQLPPPIRGVESMDVLLPIPFVRGSGFVWRSVCLSDSRLIHMQVIQGLLSNDGKTGLLDSLILQRKLQTVQALPFALNDIGFFVILILPQMPFQTNKMAQRLVLKAIERIRKGDIPSDLFEQVKLSLHRQLLQQLESPQKRQELLQNVMTQGNTIGYLEKDLETLQSMTIADIREIAQEFLGGDRLVVTKKTGRYPTDKIQKPPFAPIRAPHTHAKSPFAEELERVNVRRSEIKIQDPSAADLYSTLDGNRLVKYFHTDNTYNSLFSLELIFFRGSYDYPRTEVLEGYMDLIGTQSMNAQAFNTALQVIGATITYTATRNYYMVSLQGYDKHFEEAVSLLAQVLTEPDRDKGVLRQLVQLKKTNDSTLKSSSHDIAARFSDYIRYGERAEYRRALTRSQMKKLTPRDMVEELQAVLSSEVDIHYCGTLSSERVQSVLEQRLPLEHVSEPFGGYTFLRSEPIHTPRIYTAHQPHSTQSVIRAYIQLGELSAEEESVAALFGTYFGSGMGSVLFQEVREYRSLAYSVSAQMVIPHRNSSERMADMTFSMSTQADKTEEALHLLEELIQHPPFDIQRLTAAAESTKSVAYSQYPNMRMRSRRLSSMIRQGLSEDYALELLRAAEGVTLERLREFHAKYIAGKPIAYMIVGDSGRMGLTTPTTDVSIDEILHL